MSDEQIAADALAELQASMQSVQLATVGEDGEPHMGYTPFLMENHQLIVFVSQLALHTRDLLADPRVSVMIISDESSSSQIFARSRVSYQCLAEVVPRDSEDYDILLDRYEQRHGKMVGLLRQLPDFVLFRLIPQRGQLVVGFGKAYRLSGENLDQFELARSA
ncbi:HugZ family pyridoxamine 5'-phosphate oxidase [Granulosicoccus sp. 3-233]|uniref:HugZ family pyridoxamine 5'-phosphate oxidase n=1 Tax=Granulosicoccus sp. 3-233 TaxID=3417969 RepID=UPI003D35867C